MTRGKLKYRDVVGGGPGKSKGGRNSRKSKQQHNKRPRKTYSLYKKDNRKRKSEFHDKPESKRHKVEDEPKPSTIIEEFSSESEEEELNPMEKLREIFGQQNKKSLAIDSSDDDEEDKESIGADDEIDTLNASESDDLDQEDLSEDANSDNEVLEGDLQCEELVSDHTDDEDNDNDEEIQLDEAQEIIDDNDDEDTENPEDPFIKHLFYDLHESSVESLKATPKCTSVYNEIWPELGNVNIEIPQFSKIETSQGSKPSLLGNIEYASPGKPPVIFKASTKPQDISIKPQLVENLLKANRSLPKGSREFLTPLQQEMFSIFNNYQDFYYSQRTFSNAEQIRYVYCLHAMNHIIKTRLRVLHHNVRLKDKDDVPDEFRDQGVVRPKILFVLPFKDSAYKVVRMLIDILLHEDKGNVIKKKRFMEEFTGNELTMPKKNPKPEDYEQLFAGNTSDDFKIGITITKKSLKLFANFYSSDIIIASPLGLRRLIGAEGEPNRDYDFLNSIELLILDQTEIFIMQNWDHILRLFDHLHLPPKKDHGTDVSRVRMWNINGWMKYYCQTLIFSSNMLPEINSIFNKRCVNYAGRVKTANPIVSGALSHVVVAVPHVFQRFEASSFGQALEARFDFFVKRILPKYRDSLMKQTVIFVPSYFDYVKLRNHFKREDIGFVQICEYSKEGKVARARDMFFHGDAHFLLYTERYHFFNRIRLKGIRHLIFYQLPNFPHFYNEMCNLMQEGYMNRKIGNSMNMTITVLYSKYDVYQLASVVGQQTTEKLLSSERNVHLLTTGANK